MCNTHYKKQSSTVFVLLQITIKQNKSVVWTCTRQHEYQYIYIESRDCTFLGINWKRVVFFSLFWLDFFICRSLCTLLSIFTFVSVLFVLNMNRCKYYISLLYFALYVCSTFSIYLWVIESEHLFPIACCYGTGLHSRNSSFLSLDLILINFIFYMNSYFKSQVSNRFYGSFLDID